MPQSHCYRYLLVMGVSIDWSSNVAMYKKKRSLCNKGAQIRYYQSVQLKPRTQLDYQRKYALPEMASSHYDKRERHKIKRPICLRFVFLWRKLEWGWANLFPSKQKEPKCINNNVQHWPETTAQTLFLWIAVLSPTPALQCCQSCWSGHNTQLHAAI